MDQHQQAFIDEAKELLPDLEEGLLTLEENPDDPETINSVFRALHTIKGSGSMFGFEKIEHFTHDLENAFEQVRSGAFTATPALIDLTLAARDQIQYLVNIAEEDLPDENEAVRADILEKLKVLIAPAPDAASATDPTETSSEPDQGPQAWMIRYRPEPQDFAFGSDPLLLLGELKELGSAEISALLDGIPPLDAIDPETCYMGWEIKLIADANENAIRDVFIFAGDDCELTLQKLDENHQTPKSETQSSEITSQKPETETKKSAAVASGKSSSTVRVPSERLDKMVNLVGELVIAQARLSQLGNSIDHAEISGVAEEIERLTSDMRDTTMSMRMVQIGSVFGKYKRIVRDLTRDLGKQVDIETAGGETELDKTVIERLHDPMVHLIRNAIDHGIEAPDARLSTGKPKRGTIQLTATHSGAYVLISVIDDGAGLDRDRILAKAIERGLTTADADLSDQEIYDFILQPGFSTKQQVSALSGRGVGMDVVAKSIRQLGGRIQLDSEPGQGSSITLRLPLTLAIIDGLQIQCDASDYVIPLGAIEECVEMTPKQLASDRYRRVLNLRDEMVPYISLRDLFGASSPRPPHEKIVIINDDGNRFGIVIDRVVGELQAVIKPLGKLCRDIAEVSGATILGNGTVALILDLGRIFDAVLEQEQTSKE